MKGVRKHRKTDGLKNWEKTKQTKTKQNYGFPHISLSLQIVQNIVHEAIKYGECIKY